MYNYIRGTVAEIGTDRAVIEAGGVGYEIIAGTMALKQLREGKEGKLFTYLHLAEGVMALYGFADRAEKEMFIRLIGVNRVGPKLAIAVLSKLTPQDIAAAIVTQNARAFEHVPGMGKKTAQRVLLELKEQVGTEEMLGGTSEPGSGAPVANDIRTEAVAALVALGYDGLSASRAVTSVKEATTVEELITKALRAFAK
ncbi:MAG: Holliday junction branch migration protein RuvA [Clostridia bacterium]|nr:Holliday junction branch migration protein RuvA [Clostridia bacterium]